MNKVLVWLLMAGVVFFPACQSAGLQNQPPSSKVWQYVPEDTLFVYASFKPYPHKKHLAANQTLLSMIPVKVLQRYLPLRKVSNDGLRFMYAMVLDFIREIKKPGVLRRYGLADQSFAWGYSVDGVPVHRFELENVAAFRRTLDRIGEAASVSPRVQQLHGYELRRYRLLNKLDLLFITGQGTGIFSLDLHHSSNFLPVVLQRKKPARAYDVSILRRIGKKYRLMDEGYGYVDLERMVSHLLDNQGQMATLAAALQDYAWARQVLATIRSERCRLAYRNGIRRSARVITGYEQMKTTASEMVAELVTIYESSDQPWITAMNRSRGYISPVVKDPSAMIAIAVGVDLDRYYRFHSLAKYPLGCETAIDPSGIDFLLVPQVKQWLRKFAGIKGVAVTVFELQLQPGSFNAEKADALVSISADNASMLLTRLPFSLPPVPEDGTPVILPVPTPAPVKLSIQGDHLVVYTGKRASRQALGLAGAQAGHNGVTYVSMDAGRLVEAVRPLLRLVSNSGYDWIQSVLESLARSGMHITTRGDYFEDGYREHSTLRLRTGGG